MINALLRVAKEMRERESSCGFKSGTLASWASRIEGLADEAKHEREHAEIRMAHLERVVHEVAPCPKCGKDEAYAVRATGQDGVVWVCPCGYSAGLSKWPRRVFNMAKAGTAL